MHAVCGCTCLQCVGAATLNKLSIDIFTISQHATPWEVGERGCGCVCGMTACVHACSGVPTLNKRSIDLTASHSIASSPVLTSPATVRSMAWLQEWT